MLHRKLQFISGGFLSWYGIHLCSRRVSVDGASSQLTNIFLSNLSLAHLSAYLLTNPAIKYDRSEGDVSQ